jgi:hypothetical protein
MNSISTLRRAFIATVFFISFSLGSRAQYVAIPDTAFGYWLHSNGFSTCMTGNSASGWRLDTTCSAVLSAVNISCSHAGISDLTGIRYFKNINYLDCSYNQLSTLPLLPLHLPAVVCHHNVMVSVPALSPFLRILICANNQLTSLPALPDSMEELEFANNGVTSLPTLPDSLLLLDCSLNHITHMPVLPHHLRNLTCSSNVLDSLPELPASLRYLHCNYDNLTFLPALPDSIISIECTHNTLSSLPRLPDSLYFYLDCSWNQLTSLPALPNILGYLDCHANRLTSLPALPDSLLTLDCSYNSNLACLPFVYQHVLTLFNITSTNIHCLPDSFTAVTYDTNPHTMRLCDSTSTCFRTSGISEPSAQPLSVYPNPNNGSFTLETSQMPGAEYIITDMLGQIVQQKAITSDKQTIALGDAATGVYTLMIRGKSGAVRVVVR